MATLADFRSRFPELDGYADALVENVLAEATAELEPTVFESRIDLAILYFAAHLLTSAAGVGAAAAAGVKSVTAGSASVTFGDVAATQTAPGSTAYGRRYLQLVRQNTGAQVI